MESMLSSREVRALEIKNRLRAEGKTIRTWAKEHNYPETEVYKVLNGERKGAYGRSHAIAKDLGFFGENVLV